MTPACPTCGRDGVWTGQSGVSTAEVQRLDDHYRCPLRHTWTVSQ